MAEASFDQARKAFEKFLDRRASRPPARSRSAARRVRAGAKDISAKAISYAEKNVQASLDYAQALLHAKDLTEVMRLHSEYVQAQMRSLAEQASEMGQTVSRAAMDAAKPKSWNFWLVLRPHALAPMQSIVRRRAKTPASHDAFS